MQEKQGVATRLLYQLYLSLGERKKGQTGGNVQPTVKMGLLNEEHDIRSDAVCMWYMNVVLLDQFLKKKPYYFLFKKIELTLSV